jgi:hypothetical protein
MTRAPVFLRPASYRRRRRRDAARLLPFVGGFLFLLPILWAPAQSFRRDTAPDGIFLFAAWAAMIVLAFLISRSLAGGESAGGDDPETDGPADAAPLSPRDATDRPG